MRDTLLIIHILAAGAWIGANVVQLFVNPRINTQDTVIAAYWHRTVVGFMRFLYMPAALIVLITGVLLVTAVDDSPYEMADPFVSMGFVAVIVGAVLGMAFFAPQGRKAADAYDRGDRSGAAAIEKKIALGGLLDTVIIVVTVVAMVSKWGAG